MPTQPSTRRDDLVETLHGVEVADPYRWLEDTESAETREWIEAQNRHTRSHLDTIAQRGPLRERLAARWDRPRRGVPWRRGATWLQLRNTGLQDQDVLWIAEAVRDADGAPDPAVVPEDAHWRVLLDLNEISAEGTTALMATALTVDGRRLAYATSDAGSDWMTWRVLDLHPEQDDAPSTAHEDEIRWSKFSGAAWLPDGKSFLYGWFEPPAEGEEFLSANRSMRLRRHVLGTPQDEDETVFEAPDRPDWNFTPAVTHDGAWLVVTVTEGTFPHNRLRVAPLTAGDAATEIGAFVPLVDDDAGRHVVLGHVDGELWVQTDRNAPTEEILAADPATGAGKPDQWRSVLPAGDDRIEQARIVGARTPDDPGWLVAVTLHHAKHLITVHDLDGTLVEPIGIDEPVTVTGLSGGRSDTAVHISVESFTRPTRLLTHELSTGTTTPLWEPPVALDDLDGVADVEIVTHQVFVNHARDDGSPGDPTIRVPVTLVRRTDVVPTGTVPTLLYGYGGFDIPITPMFRTHFDTWVRAGGLLAVANLRGGGEYGRPWHDDGRLAHKQHVFDDAIAVADWLCGNAAHDVTDADGTTLDASGGRTGDTTTWTSPGNLGITGGSNGGLLVGACLTQVPDRWGACVPEVGVLDLLRFHKFTIGWAWTSDYGDPDDPDQFPWVWSYSPYHRLVEGTCYPPTLITTGDHDDRVVPGHSFKFAAALQYAQGCDNPTLIRIDTSAGHGAGKPVSKQIDERADVLAFLSHHLGLRVV